ncbi:MAG: transcriptional regulator GcvA [Pararhodobacter sp.]
MPPLTALRAFEAAGRLGGFAPAAQELGVTPGAVTAHLKTLETALGVSLFERRHRGVRLTDVGARVLPDFTAAFSALEAAVRKLETEALPGLVRIATTPDIALLWLSPRLSALRAQGLRVVPVSVATPEAARAVADLGVFFEDSAEGAPLIAVASPALARTLSAPASLDPAQCQGLTGPEGDWPRWAAAAGLAGFAPRGPVQTSAALALEEAANGAGVLVIAQPLAQAALDAGRVVALFGVSAPGARALSVSPLRDVGTDSPAARVLEVLGA